MGCGCSSKSGEDKDDEDVEVKKKKHNSNQTGTVGGGAGAAADRKQTKKSKRQGRTSKPQQTQQRPSYQKKKRSSRQQQQQSSAEAGGGGGRSRAKAKTSAGSKGASSNAASSTRATVPPTKKKSREKGGGSSCFGTTCQPAAANAKPTTTSANATASKRGGGKRGAGAKAVVSNAVTAAPTNTFSSAFSGSVAVKGAAKSKAAGGKNTSYSSSTATSACPSSCNSSNNNASTSNMESQLSSYVFKSEKVNALDEAKDGESIKAAMRGRRLGRDQSLLKAAVGGREVCQVASGHLMTRKVVEKLRNSADRPDRPDIALLLEPHFVAMHLIVPCIYLTGTFGLQREAFTEAAILVVINATTELPMLSAEEAGGGLLTYRVPVDDDPAHRIADYFDDVADLMETARRRGYGSVVHCAAGVSRSTTLVLAYLLKYTDMSLHQAFRHTRAIRPVVRPNMGFMSQLIAYETAVQGNRRSGGPSVKMVTVRDGRRGVSVTVPDFYPKEFPDLYEWEVNKAVALQKGAAATAAAAAGATSASSSSTSTSRPDAAARK